MLHRKCLKYYHKDAYHILASARRLQNHRFSGNYTWNIITPMVTCIQNSKPSSVLFQSQRGLCATHSMDRLIGTHIDDNNNNSSFKLVVDIVNEKIANKSLIAEPKQVNAARKLSRLQQSLKSYNNEPLLVSSKIIQYNNGDNNLTKNIKNAKDCNQEQEFKNNNRNDVYSIPMKVPRGLYLFGKVGTGKTMLMDTFYDNATIHPSHRKIRVHFHAFMQNIHERIHKLKKLDLKIHGRNFKVDTRKENNPIYRVAVELASEVSLLCFDEFQVTDVADALIVSQLFSVLFSKGTVVVATSNRPPEALYEGGLNRGYFLPFIDLLKKYCIVHDMDTEIDYRRVISANAMHSLDPCVNSVVYPNFFFIMERKFDGSDAEQMTYQNCLNQLMSKVNLRSIRLEVAFSRVLHVDEACSQTSIAKFNFQNLCKNRLCSSDYRSIAKQFKIIVIEDIPFLTLKDHDESRRFITLIDELYDAGCALLCSAAAESDKLFIHDGDVVDDDNHSSSSSKLDDDVEVLSRERLGIDVAQSNGLTLGELASVRELSFAFRRASSRLTEMCSKRWWNKQGVLHVFHDDSGS